MSFAWGDGNRFPSLLLNPLGVYPKAGPTETPIQGVSYGGQLWDARALVLKLIQSAKRSLILIDNWATAETLDLFAKKRKGVKVTILTSEHYAVHPHPHMPKIPRHNSSDFCYTTPTHEIIMHTAENQIVVYPGVATLDMLAKRGRGVKIELADLKSQIVTSTIDVREAA